MRAAKQDAGEASGSAGITAAAFTAFAQEMRENFADTRQDLQGVKGDVKNMPQAILVADHQRRMCQANAARTALALAPAPPDPLYVYHQCSGSLLGSADSNLIITASHCVPKGLHQEQIAYSTPALSLASGNSTQGHSITVQPLVFSKDVDFALLVKASPQSTGGQQQPQYDMALAEKELRTVIHLLQTQREAVGVLFGTPVHVTDGSHYLRHVEFHELAEPRLEDAPLNAADGSAHTSVSVALTVEAAQHAANGPPVLSARGNSIFRGMLQPVQVPTHGGNSGTAVWKVLMHDGQCKCVPYGVISARYNHNNGGLMSTLPNSLSDVLTVVAEKAASLAEEHSGLAPEDSLPRFHMRCPENAVLCSLEDTRTVVAETEGQGHRAAADVKCSALRLAFPCTRAACTICAASKASAKPTGSGLSHPGLLTVNSFDRMHEV